MVYEGRGGAKEAGRRGEGVLEWNHLLHGLINIDKFLAERQYFFLA